MPPTPTAPWPAEPPPGVGYEHMQRFIDDLSEGKIIGADVDSVLAGLLFRAVRLERGIVGPTGAGSTLAMSVLGPIFGLWGLIAGTRIMFNAGDAQAYLNALKRQTRARQAQLQQLRDSLEDAPQWAQNRQDLDLRLFAMDAFLQGVDRSRHEQTFNMAFPGGVQVAASALILTLAADLLPNIGNQNALLSATTTAALGTGAAGALGIYALASFLKHSYYFVQSWRTHTMKPLTTDSDDMRRFIGEYNQTVGLHRLYYGLNSASWGMYVGGAVALALISSGAALSHGGAVAAVVTATVAAMLWDVLWGNQCAPHNALTPHVDRNYLDTTERLKDVWLLLDKERADLRGLIEAMFDTMPKHHKSRPPRNLWQRLDKRKRYKYFWRCMPKLLTGGHQHLASWAVKDRDAITPLVHKYLTHHTRYEIDYLSHKTSEKTLGLLGRAHELEHMPHAQLKETWDKDLEALEYDVKRLEAMRSLQADLSNLSAEQIHTDPQARAAWNRARLMYVSTLGLLAYCLRTDDIKEHPEWFDCDRRRQFLRRTHYTNIRLSPKGFAALGTDAPFSPRMERNFLAAVVNPELNAYEIRAVFKQNAQAHRGWRRHRAQEAARAEAQTAHARPLAWNPLQI